MVAAMFIDDAVTSSVESCDSFERASRHKPGMKLDAELPNRDALVKELVDDFILEAFDVHLQQIDHRIAIVVHNS